MASLCCPTWSICISSVPFVSLLQLMQMMTAVAVAKGVIAGAVVAGAVAILAEAVTGNATISFRTITVPGTPPVVTTRIVMEAPVAWPAVAVGAVLGGIGAGVELSGLCKAEPFTANCVHLE